MTTNIDVEGASTTTIWNEGFIGSHYGGPASYGHAAIIKRGPGHVSLYNDGTLHGRIDFYDSDSSNVENTSNTSWHTTGYSVLSNGSGGGYINDESGGGDLLDGVFVNDFVLNEGFLATADSGVETTINFAGGTDVFANLGTFVAGEPTDAPSQTNLDNLEYFYNSGDVFFGANQTGVPYYSDGNTDDHIDAGDASFYGGDGSLYSGGGDGSTFFMDAFVGAGNNADTLTVGAISGHTQIFVRDTNAGGPGAFNAVLLVDGTSSTSDAFSLGDANGDKIVKGLVTYVLATSSGDWALVGLPSETGAQMSQIMSGLQEMWHQSDHFDQITDLRRALADGTALPSQGGGFMEDGGSIWIRGVIADAERSNSHSFSSNGGSLDHNVGYRQFIQGVQIGADMLNRLDDGAAMAFGAFGGYVNSDQRFTATLSNARADINAWQAGAYLTYLNGPAFVDGMVKVEWVDGGFHQPGPPPVTAEISGTNIGAQLNAGYRFDVTERVFFEPIGTLSYVRSNLDTTSVYNGSVDFDDGDSFRGRLGAQFGLNWMSGDTTIRPFGAVSLWHEFEGDNSVTLNSGGSSWSIADNAVEDWWQFGLGVEVVNANGFSAFVRADYSIAGNPINQNSEYTVAAFRGGLRWSFGGAPPPPPPPPPPPAVQTFIVFFDFDKSDLTAEAQEVVANAVTEAMRTGRTRIEIVGHTDTSGSAVYNQALSERRAQSVKDEMVRLNIAEGNITAGGRGFAELLVQTGPGVREPQNRRAVIDLNE